MTERGDFLGVVARAGIRSASGDWAEAATLWAQVTADNPVNGDYWARLAEAQFASGDYTAARQAYEKVLELGVRAVYRQHFWEDLPELVPGEVAYRIACCQAALGRRDEAIDALAVALDRGFRDLSRAEGEEYWKPWHDDQRLRDLLGLIDTDGMTRDQGWRADLRLLAREIKRRAYAPFALISEDEFDRGVARLDHDIPGLTDAQILVGMMKLVRHLDDGHAGVSPPKENKDLHGLGIIDDPAKATLTIRAADGTSREVTLDAEPGEVQWDRYPPGWTALADIVPGRSRPLHLRHRDLPYWFEYLPEADLVYFQYNAVRDHPAETFAAFCDRLFGFIQDRRPGRLVIDMRWNGGGNTFLAQPLLHHLIACPAINRRGALFVIIGRLTFSAAQNTATAIDRETNAIFVGEPTGSRPNFIGEVVYFELPYSKVRANAADLFWQTSWPWDHRTWIAPDIYVPPTFEAFSRNDDPAMNAILAIRERFPGA